VARKIHIHLPALHRTEKVLDSTHKFYSEYLMRKHITAMKRKGYAAVVVVKNPDGSHEVTYHQPEKRKTT
jgi:hypothetical protein